MEMKRIHLPQVVSVAIGLDLLDKAYGITSEDREVLDALRHPSMEESEDDF